MGSVNRISVVARTVLAQDNRTDVCICIRVPGSVQTRDCSVRAIQDMLILDSATRCSVSKDFSEITGKGSRWRLGFLPQTYR